MSYSRLGSGAGGFSNMMKNGFGIVTVMTDVKVYAYSDANFNNKTLTQVINALNSSTELFTLDTLKIANLTIEGPSKTITGGQEASPIVKYGKTARIEMQDALGKADAIDYLGGAIVEYESSTKDTVQGVHLGRDFNAPVTLLGKTFFVDKNGNQIDVYIVIYKMLPDSVFNLTQDAEGDATVFDLNGDLLVAPITVGNSTGNSSVHKEFYGIAPLTSETDYYAIDDSWKLTMKSGYTGTLNGTAVAAEGTTLTSGSASMLVVTQTSTSSTVLQKVIYRP